MRMLLAALFFVTGGCGKPAATPPTPARDSGAAPPNLAATSPVMDAAHLRLHPGFDPTLPCTCEAEKLGNGWCWHCNIGYIAGHRLENARLFETLDPHGHQLDLQSLQLQMCREVIASNGWCEATGMGFVNGIAFFTRLTYGLARGTAIDPAGVTCEVCRHGDVDPVWCERCPSGGGGGGRGVVGNVAIADRELFEATAREYRVLLKAIEKARDCEWCAAAMVVHRTCPMCLISYETDTPVQLPRGAPATRPSPAPATPSSSQTISPSTPPTGAFCLAPRPTRRCRAQSLAITSFPPTSSIPMATR